MDRRGVLQAGFGLNRKRKSVCRSSSSSSSFSAAAAAVSAKLVSDLDRLPCSEVRVLGVLVCRFSVPRCRFCRCCRCLHLLLLVATRPTAHADCKEAPRNDQREGTTLSVFFLCPLLVPFLPNKLHSGSGCKKDPTHWALHSALCLATKACP